MLNNNFFYIYIHIWTYMAKIDIYIYYKNNGYEKMEKLIYWNKSSNKTVINTICKYGIYYFWNGK